MEEAKTCEEQQKVRRHISVPKKGRCAVCELPVADALRPLTNTKE